MFDFCSDEKILSKVTGHPNPIESREYIEGNSEIVQAQMLQALAAETNNIELMQAAIKLETDLWKEFDNENHDSMIEGCIID